MKIGSKLKQLRKAKSLSLKELSNLTGVSVSFLSDIEQERSNPSLDSLELIAKELDVPISSFFDGEGLSLNESLKYAKLSPVLDLLEDFDNWSESDRQELLYYLKVKNIVRNK